MIGTIAVDVDAVCADMLPAWLSIYNEEFNDTLTPADITAWDTSRFVKPEAKQRIWAILRDGEKLYGRTRPVSGALPGVAQLWRDGHNILYVSTCVGHADAKAAWLEKHGFMRYGHFVGLVAGNYLMAGDERKLKKSVVQADVIIDDYAPNLAGFPIRILYSDDHTVYNHISLDGSEGFFRARGWEETVRAVQWFMGRRLVDEGVILKGV